MNARFPGFGKLVLALLFALAPALTQAADAKPAVYRFSPVNQWDINRTATYWNPIIQYVSEKSGIQLQLKIGRTSADTTSYVLAQEVEFVFSNHLFSPEREALGWKVFGRRNAPPLRAQIAVPADSAITSLDQLKGQQIGFAGPEAFIGYKLPYAHLLSRKIDTTAVQAVGSNSMLIDGFSVKENKKFRVLWTSDEYHDLALMYSTKKVPEKDVKAISAAFLGMHQDPRGAQILHAASNEVGLKQDAYFIPASDNDYASYRRFYQTAPASLR